MEDAHDLDQRLFAVEWAPTPCAPGRVHPGDWLIVAEDGADPLPERLAGALADRGGHADIVRGPLGLEADIIAAVGPGATAVPGRLAAQRGVIVVCQPAAPHADEAGLRRARLRVGRVVSLARLLAGLPTGKGAEPPRLIVVSRDAQPVRPGDGSALEHAALRGLCRAVAAEHPRLAVLHVDLALGEVAEQLAAEVLADRRAEDEVAWREGVRYVARLRPAPLRDEDRRTTTIYFGHDGVAVQARRDTLELVHRARRRPGIGEIEIAVRAIAVADPAALLADGGPGVRCAGVVATVGRGVTGVRVGDRVATMMRGSALGSFITTAAASVAPVAEDCSFEQAVGAPSPARRGVLPAVPYSLDAFVRAFPALRTERRASPVIVTLPREGAVRVPVPPHLVPVVRHEGSYVVSGGLGRLGLLSARWLATSGAGRIILGGRSEPTAYVDLVLDELRQTGAQIEVVGGDVGDPAVAWAMVAAATATGLPLRGVVHAAAVVEDARLAEVDDAHLERVFAPKALGAWHLHHACAEEPLDWWLGFSSASALLGRAGRTACAAANSWLDGFTIWRRAQGLPALSIGWGSWAGQDASMAANGFAMIRPEEGIDVCDRLLRHSRAHSGYLSTADWPPAGKSGRTSAFFASPEPDTAKV